MFDASVLTVVRSQSIFSGLSRMELQRECDAPIIYGARMVLVISLRKRYFGLIVVVGMLVYTCGVSNVRV